MPYEHLALRKDGSVFPVEVRVRTVPYHGRVVRVAAIRDVAELRQSEAALRRYAARMQGLHEIDRAILSARSPEAIALAALGHIRRLVPSIRASVAIFDQPDQQARILAVSAGDATYLTPDQRVPLEYFGDLADLRRGQPSRADDLSALADRSEIARVLLADGVRAALVMPLIPSGELIGALNLNDLIPETEKLLRRLIGEDIELVMLMAPDLGMIKADPGQIEQVLINLAINARHAMPGGGKLTIETRNVVIDEDESLQYIGVTPGAYVLLAISDTGVGMDREIQEHLFEPFFTTKGPGRGTGLGLATCYGIVKQHGGHISAYCDLKPATCNLKPVTCDL